MSVIVTLLLVASIAVNVWFLKRKSNRRSAARSTLMQGIKNVRELATIRQNFQSVVMFNQTGAFLGIPLPGTGRKFILKYSGTLTCGNDLSKIQVTERFAVNRVRIAVPSAKLLDVYANMDSVKVYDQRAGLFASLKLEDQNREIVANLEEMRQETLQGGILHRADENTRALLTSLAVSLGMEAEIVFENTAVAEKKTPVAPESTFELAEESPNAGPAPAMLFVEGEKKPNADLDFAALITEAEMKAKETFSLEPEPVLDHAEEPLVTEPQNVPLLY